MPANLVLCYHALSPGWHADLSVTPERFRRQMEILLAHGYRAATFSETVAAPPRAGLVAVTFDDAFRSTVTRAAPVLDELGMVATLFVPTDYVTSGARLAWEGTDHWLQGDYADELAPASWEEIVALGHAGWEVGSHTCSHPHLTQLGDAALSDELTRSRLACEERLDAPCAAIAYPYGDVDKRVVSASRRAGYRAAAALPERRITRPDALCWPRVGVYHVDDERRFRLKISPAIAAMRRSAAWTAVSAVRHRRDG